MNRWIVPGAVVVGVALVTAAATVLGPQPLPETPFAAVETRVSVACPGFSSVTATVRTAAAAAGAGLRAGPVTRPGAGEEVSGLHVATAPAYQRVSALLPDPFAATTTVSAAVGADRGLSAVACAAPGTGHWFGGVDLGVDAQSEVVVANLDQAEATVDLAVYAQGGRVAAPRGITVDGNSVQTISLGTVERSGPVGVQVSSGDGRVAAFLRQRTWDGDTPLGADWLAETTPPATDQVIPGLPAGAGGRRLVVTNPGERTATVALALLSATGVGTVVGSEQLEVPAQTTRTIDLAAGLQEQVAALRLTSDQPVVAGAWLDSGGSDARRDPAFTSATPPLPADSVWPVALGRGADTVLHLANAGEGDATASVVLATGSEPAGPTEVVVPAGAVVTVAVPRAAANLIRVRTTAPALHGALVATDRLGRVRGLTVLPLATDERRTEVPVVFDPHAGS